MAAAITDLFTKVGLPGTATTLESPGFTIGNTSINVASTSNWQTETLQVFAMDQVTIVSGAEVRVPGSYRELVGIVASATSISSVSFAPGFTPRNYPAGSSTRVYIPVTSTRENMLVQGLLVSHFPTGRLKDSALTTNTLPKFYAQFTTADVTLVSGVAYKIPFNSIYSNIGGGYNGTNGNFTVPETGSYSFTANAGISAGAGDVLYIRLTRNGGVFRNGNWITTSLAAIHVLEVSVVNLILTAGDIIAIEVLVSSAANRTLKAWGDATTFSGGRSV